MPFDKKRIPYAKALEGIQKFIRTASDDSVRAMYREFFPTQRVPSLDSCDRERAVSFLLKSLGEPKTKTQVEEMWSYANHDVVRARYSEKQGLVRFRRYRATPVRVG